MIANNHNNKSRAVRLKPVMFTETQESKNEKLRKIIEVKNVAQIYQTLDKIAMRKDYHEALSRNDISFDFLVGGIKDVALNGKSDDSKLKAYQTLLKSVGMDKYDNVEGSSGTWEEVLLSKIEEAKSNDTKLEIDVPTYDVVVPELPESARLQDEEEREISGSIYDTK